MFAERIRAKSFSTSTGENLTIKCSSQLGEIDPFFGIIVNGPASKIPLVLFTILKLYSSEINDVFFMVNLRVRVAYISVGLNSRDLILQS